ncbi:MAG: hypothetical protein KJ749_14010, partial [Planctomycetes bacterium]|nr:hypothetical protein [Planctomycetota bacterium]
PVPIARNPCNFHATTTPQKRCKYRTKIIFQGRLLRLRRFDEAIAELRETLRLQPRHTDPRRNLERALDYQRQTADP